MKALRAIFGIVFIVAAVYCTYLLVPPYYNNYQLQDYVASEARMNTYTQKSEDEMRESVWRTVKNLDLPVKRDQINVRREGQSVSISVNYTVHVDIPTYPLDLQFEATSRNKAY